MNKLEGKTNQTISRDWTQELIQDWYEKKAGIETGGSSTYHAYILLYQCWFKYNYYYSLQTIW